MRLDKSLKISEITDTYFTNTKNIVDKYGDQEVVYAVFLRKDCIYACKEATSFVQKEAKKNNQKIEIIEQFKEGDLVNAGEVLFFIKGSFSFLSELETLFLQLTGLPCMTAHNAYEITKSLPNISFISMLARHCANPYMAISAEYGVSIGSKAAINVNSKTKGFIGTSIEAAANFFPIQKALGTMPHSLIGYANSTLNAAKMFFDVCNNQEMTVLVDYFGKEVTDSLEISNHFVDLAKQGKLSVRIDTHKQRYLENLDEETSIKIIRKHYPQININDLSDLQKDHIIGKGVSLAAVCYLRECLDKKGFNKVKIVASSGFNATKCSILSPFNPPIDIIGTGSSLPENWGETFTTADIISYNNNTRVKIGREYIVEKWLSIQR